MIRKDTRFVKYKHLASGRIDNMPERLWIDHISKHRTRKHEFEYLELIDISIKGVPTAIAGEVKEVAVIEDTLECPLCGFIAKDEKDLGEHKEEKHG